MKFVIEIFEKNEKHFVKGGKYEKFFPFFEAMQTFVYLPQKVTKKGPHVRDSLDTKRYMSIVIISLIPCLLFGIYNTGLQSQLAAGLATDLVSNVLVGLKVVIPLLMISYGVGLGLEFLFALIRGHEINEGFLVTGILYALILPPEIPLWMAAVGIAFGVIIGKEVFGGSGRNFLNPALTARAFLFFTYPAYMSGEKVWTFISVSKERLVDGFSGATALAVAASVELPQNVHNVLVDSGFTLKNLFIGYVPGSVGETSVIAILIGAAILLITRVGSWRTMLGCLVGGVGFSMLLNVLSGPSNIPLLTLSPVWHLCMGGFAFGAVFMATDPVSSPHLESSKFIYGLLIGCLAIIIRCINPAYPEGMMLAILLMNVFAPFIDHFYIQSKLKKRIPNAV